MESTQSRLHPIVWAAAVSVIIFSGVGIAAITGILPAAGSKPGEPPAATAPVAAAPAEALNALPTESTPTDKSALPAAKVSAEPAPPPAAPKLPQAATPKPATKPASQAKPRPVQVAQNEVPVVERDPARAYEPAPPPASSTCRDCGVIETVREIKSQGEGTGLGAVAGGVLGGVLGHQVGGGRGQDVATVLGAVGGAVAGHQVEKTVRTGSKHEVVVRFGDGSSQVFTQDQAPAWRSGDRVKVVNGVIVAN